MQFRQATKSRFVIVTLTLGLLMSSCGDDSTATTDAPDTIHLTFSSWQNEGNGWVDSFVWCLDEIERRSEGRIIFDRFWGGSIVPNGQEIEAISSGLVDVSNINPSFASNQPYVTVGLVPGLTTSFVAANRALLELSRTNATVIGEWADWNVMPFCTNGIGNSHLLINREIRTVDDLDGLTVRATGGLASVSEAMGMSAVNTPVPEMRSALEQGQIDGVVSAYSLFDAIKGEEFAPYVIEVEYGVLGTLMGMNRSAFESLPPDLQAIFIEVASESPAGMGTIYATNLDAARDAMVARGLEIIAPSPEVAEATEAAVLDARTEWVETLEADGHGDALAVLNDYIRLIEVYETAGASG